MTKRKPEKKARTYRLSKASLAALRDIVDKTLWSDTLAVEMSIRFASQHKDFPPYGKV